MTLQDHDGKVTFVELCDWWYRKETVKAIECAFSRRLMLAAFLLYPALTNQVFSMFMYVILPHPHEPMSSAYTCAPPAHNKAGR